MVARVRARIEGRVQGVGFRPAVLRHAVACGLTGFVRNDPQGVTLDVEGDEERVAAFFAGLEKHAPRQADIVRVTRRRLAPKGYDSFDVVESAATGRGRKRPDRQDWAVGRHSRRDASPGPHEPAA